MSIETKLIDISKIEQNENSRVVYKTADLADLMHSMKDKGQLQPIRVIDLGQGKYDTVFGNRRLVAAKRLGWKQIEAQVVPQVEMDENERDIVGLVENAKRQNTSVAEDGRMYQVLVDRGLSVNEIAARTGSSLAKIELGLDVVKHVPADVRGKITNRVTGRKPEGTISATAAHKIMILRKQEGLNRKQTRALMNYAAQDGTSTQHFDHIAPLVKRGATIEAAIKTVGKMRRVTLQFFVDEKAACALEKHQGESLIEVLTSRIEGMKDVKIYRFGYSDGIKLSMDHRTRHDQKKKL